ncbi:MAG: putative peptide synthetase protein [Verrucomicrobiaceae bacterium]|nr:putative peptide synthetase protein [Verrucomicrobiaceae bacterium]
MADENGAQQPAATTSAILTSATTTAIKPSFIGDIIAVIDTSEPQREIFTAINAGGATASIAFNESMTLTMSGAVDEPSFRQALEQLVLRHDALRATFNRYGTQFCIHRKLSPDYHYIDATAAADAVLKREQQRAVQQPFDLHQGPLLRVALIKLAEQKFAAIITAHHIVCDGWSIAVLLEDIGELYSAAVERRPAVLAPATYYLQYLQHLRSDDYRQLAAVDENYWVEKFRDSQPILDLPTDNARPPLRTFNSSRYDHLLAKELVVAIKKVGAANKSSFVATLLAGFSILLYRLTGQADVVIGMPAAGQSIEGLDYLVGHCVNTLPIRCQLDAKQSFAANLQSLRDQLFETYDHQRLTFGSLVARLGMRRDPSRIPLVPILYNIDQGIQSMRFSGLDVLATSNPRNSESFEMFLNATERNGEVLLECQYNSDLYSAATIARWMAIFEKLLRQFSQEPQRSISDYDVGGEADVQLWQRINATARDYPRSATVHELLSAAAAKNTQATVNFAQQSLTHAQLNQRAGRIAYTLNKAGVGAGDFVGICLDRSLDMLAAMLGVLKAGAAYVPLDPEYPADRLQLMIDDSGLKTLLMADALPADLSTHALPNVIDLKTIAVDGEIYAATVDAQAPAYMIYTSGSTGKPKGVVVPHRTIVNFLFSMADEPGLTPADRLLAVTTISFDIAVLELFLPLFVGAHLSIASRDETKDGFRLLERIREQEITAMQATPSTWRLLFAAGWEGGANFKVLTGGEALPQNLANELLNKVGSVWNMYGPTETTIWSTVARVEINKPVTLGQPIANTVLRVVDAGGSNVALGVAGELLIGGEGVTQGYWRRPDLNIERFLTLDGTRFYRTGDLVKLAANGDLLYLGRMDNQVKLRGYRIELGEIETRLANRAEIAEAAVVVQDFGDDDQRLVAFYRPRLQAQITVAQLRDHLAAALPSFMVPQQFIELEKFPQTPNGKVDRKTLSSPNIDAANNTAASPAANSAGAESADPVVLEHFRRFLKQPQLHANADFFQNGGHSLLAMRMVAEINNSMSAQLALTDLFQAPTAAALSVLLTHKNADQEFAEKKVANALHIPRKEKRDRFLMSLQQRRLWYLEQLEKTGVEYNLPASWRLRGKLNVTALQQAFDILFARHDALRVSLIEESDGLFQRVRPAVAGVLQIQLLSGANESERLAALQIELQQRKTFRFDLANDTLFQAVLFTVGPDDHVLFVLVHHAVFDGWSFDILLAELAESYNAALVGRAPQLPELPVQYGDFSEWMRQRTEASDGTDLNYWLQHLAGDLPVLDLPCGGERPEFQEHRGSALDFVFDVDAMARLRDFARQQGVTLYMVMMAIYKVLLWRYSGQRDIIVGTPISGRNFTEINDLIGFFVNALTLRDQLEPAQSFVEFLQQVKQTCLNGFAHQEVPFEQLVEKLNPLRDSSRSPIFQVMLMYQDISNRTEVFEGITREQVNVDRPGVQTDLDFWLKWDGKTMAAGFEYDRDILSPETVEAMRADFSALVQRVPEMAAASVWALADMPNAGVQHALGALNDTATDLPADALIHRLFEQQVERTPDAIATRYRNIRLSYAELNARANRIANWLDQNGIKPGAMIGVALAPSSWLQPVLLAVLKHGSTYVPIDPQFPLERIRYMIDNSGLALLICDDALDSQLVAGTEAAVIHLEALSKAIAANDIANLNRAIAAESPAYVIYTSGSTGLPKGVVVNHRGVTNYLLSMAKRPGFTATDCILAVTTLSFDIAVTELFLPLICGGNSVLVDRDVATDGDLLREIIETNGITLLQATPSSWRLLLGAGWTGDRSFRALCGGEALPPELIHQLLPKVGELWNVYGPTETTVWSTAYHVRSVEDAGVIGTPLANTSCFILNEQQQLVPIGVVGELCIGGAGVAAGYLNRPDLTAERFIDNPFGDGKLYRTGDMAQLRADGLLRYQGRSDHQVKVRGYRIELGEIESALAQYPAITQAIVIAREFQPGDYRLVAYVVAKKDEPLVVTELRKFLRDYLPSYMLPQHVVALDALPMTPNLKVDRKALPEPVIEVDAEARLPTTENELLIAAIWCEALQVERVVLEDNFFDSGGHSLTAVDAIRRVYQQTGHRFEVREFIMETLEQLAAKLDRGAAPAAGLAESGTGGAAVNGATSSPFSAPVEAENGRGVLGRFMRKFSGKGP